MSQFVNYAKRGFTLPPGCRDLVDLLRYPRERAKDGSVGCGWSPLSLHERLSLPGSMDDLERLLGILVHPRGATSAIEIHAEAFPCSVMLYHGEATGTLRY